MQPGCIGSRHRHSFSKDLPPLRTDQHSTEEASAVNMPEGWQVADRAQIGIKMPLKGITRIHHSHSCRRLGSDRSINRFGPGADHPVRRRRTAGQQLRSSAATMSPGAERSAYGQAVPTATCSPLKRKEAARCTWQPLSRSGPVRGCARATCRSASLGLPWLGDRRRFRSVNHHSIASDRHAQSSRTDRPVEIQLRWDRSFPRCPRNSQGG